MVECLLNYSGLAFTVSLWKAEQAFVKSYKPLNEKAHNLQLQSAANRSERWAVFWDSRWKDRGCGMLVCRRFTANLQFGAFCWKLTEHFIVCKEQTTAGWEWEVIQDLIFCKIRPGVQSGAVAAVAVQYLGFPKLKQLDIISTAGRGGGAGLNWAQRGTMRKAQWRKAWRSTAKRKWLIMARWWFVNGH